MDAQELRNLQEAYNQVYQEVEQLDEASPIYSRGGEQRRTQTPRQIGVKGAPHNIPKGGTTISDRDPQGTRLFTGDQDRGKGSKAAKRAAALKPKEKSFPNRLRRADGQGIRDSYDYYDIILSHLLDEGYAETLEAAEAIMVNMDEEWAQSIVEEILDEAEGSYGQTPKATAAYGKLAIKRRETPASEYSERGEKTKKVKSAEKNFYRTLNPDAGNRGKKSTKSIHPAGRKGMTQSDRDWSRGADEYGHSGYDGEGGGGSLPKGKKLERQKKTGVSAESFDLFDYILEHLVAEGYADTNEAAIAIMANMSGDWRQSIVEAATDQSDKQIERGIKTTYKAGNVLDNQHQGRSKGLNKLPAGERRAKTERMRGRLKTRRDDLFGERNRREDEARAELKKKYGL
jgi:hypothetical protein